MPIQNITSPIVFLGCYVKRASATLGFNSNPSTYEVELVPGTGNSEDISRGATGFQSGAANPGNISGFTFGNLNFLGVIQSWTESFGPQGLTYSVRMADPRIIMDYLPVITDFSVATTGINYQNLWNYASYMGSPKNAGVTKDGTLFRPLRNYINGTGIFNIYGQPFKFNLGTGFFDGSGNNSSGIASWYRVQGGLTNLNQLLQQVGTDHSFDYFVKINPTLFTSGVLSVIDVPTIKRNNQGASQEITNMVSGYRSSGILISYQRGRELRNEPITGIITGPQQTLWCSFNNSLNGTKTIFQQWGRAKDGSVIFSSTYNNKGLISLDNITGSGVAQVLSNSNFRIPYTKYTISRSFSDVYPPTMSISSSAAEVTGYIADEEVIRAALYNQKSWEAMIFKKQPTIAGLLGINFQIFRDPQNYGQIATTGAIRIPMQKLSPSGVGDRSAFTQAFLSAVYESTREQAEECYGKKYIAQMDNGFNSAFNSQWLSSNSFSSDLIFPEIEYYPVSAASYQGPSPSGIDNHNLLCATNSPVFKESDDKLKGFISFVNYDNSNNSDFPYPIDMSIVEQDKFFIEQGQKLVLPIDAQPYNLYPSYCTFEIPTIIQGITEGSMASSGFANRATFYDFLITMGYSRNQIIESGLLLKGNDNFEFGMVPPRPIILAATAQTNGPHIPCEFKTRAFGPWTASGTRNGGGVLFISDQSISPNVFNTIDRFNQAGQETAYKSLAVADIIDSAEFSLAGLPLFNLGDNIGDNSNITSMSFQFGQDGLTTNYSVRTFALPSNRTTKLLQDRIQKIQNGVLSNNRAVKDISEDIRKFELQSTKISKPSDINLPKKNQNKGTWGQPINLYTILRPTSVTNPSGRIN